MPRSKRTSCKKPNCEPSEELKQKYSSIKEDFDKQVESRIEALWAQYDADISQIKHSTNLRLLQMPAEESNMKLSEFLSFLRRYDPEGNSYDQTENVPPMKAPSTVVTKKKKPSKKSAVPPDTVRRSTRNRINVYATPLVSNINSVQATPMTIVTKLKTACRLAKPNETLVSFTGSPVFVPSGGIAEEKVSRFKKIAEENEELDENAKQKLIELRSQINDCLSRQ